MRKDQRTKMSSWIRKKIKGIAVKNKEKKTKNNIVMVKFNHILDLQLN